MKRIEAVIKPHVFGEVAAALRAAALGEVLVSQVLGSGRHRGGRAYYRGIVQVIDTFPKLKLEMTVPDERVARSSRCSAGWGGRAVRATARCSLPTSASFGSSAARSSPGR